MPEEFNVDLGERLGAQERSSGQSFATYHPDRDKDGNSIENHRDWVEAALMMLSGINGGATATAPVEGTWENDECDLTSRTNCPCLFVCQSRSVHQQP